MTRERFQPEQVRRIDAAASTLRAIADCLADRKLPPAAFGPAIGTLSRELGQLSREVARSSPPATGANPG
jgi:hypothetical protein